MAWDAKEPAAERRAVVSLLRQWGSMGRTQNCPRALGSAYQPKLPVFQTTALIQLPVVKLGSGTGRGILGMSGGGFPQRITSTAARSVSLLLRVTPEPWIYAAPFE